MYVCSGIVNEMPLFKRIDCIIVRDRNAYLSACEVYTMYFDDHFNALSIKEKTRVFTLICVYDLVHYRPHDRQFLMATDDNMYIIPYCNFV